MAEKTPVSILEEFCVKEKVAPPLYEFNNDESDSKKFVCFVYAFQSILAKGSGHSKIESKHAAAASLIHLLSQMDRFKNKISTIQHTPTTPVKEKNAVGDLITFCMQQNLQTPDYDVTTDGPDHQRKFTALCKVGGDFCTAVGQSIKKAKYFAAEAMLQQLKIKYDNKHDDIGPLAILELPTIDEIIAEYRRLKTPHIKPQTSLLRIRPNFFLKLPKADRDIAKILLNRKNSMLNSDKEIVLSVLESLKLKFKIEDVCLSDGIHKVFSLIDCDYDCVIVATANTLFAEIIKYLKTMLDIERPISARKI